MLVFGRVVLGIVFGLGILFLILSNPKGQTWGYVLTQFKRPLGVAVSITAFVWIVSSFGSVFPVRSLEATCRSIFFIILGTIVFAALKDKYQLKQICIRAFITSSFIAVFLALIEMSLLPQLYWLLKLKGWQETPIMPHAFKGFSSLAVLLIPVIAVSAWRQSWLWRGIGAAAILGFGVLVWNSYNRAAIAGLLAMLPVIAFLTLTRPGGRIIASGVLIVFGGLLVAILDWLKTSRTLVVSKLEPLGDWPLPIWLIDFQRQTIWEYAFNITHSAPWLGIGANTINFSPGADQPLPGNETLHIIPAHPHNWFFEILAETGSIGLIAMMVSATLAAYHFIRLYKRYGDSSSVAALTIMAGYWVSGLFNYSYWSAWWQVSFVLSIALVSSIHHLDHTSKVWSKT
tara:strand:- start:511 stop:1713 length:1203 start_codon:yes stop_codon:yes gene_type:complete